MALYQVQQEILKYMQGQSVDPQILSVKTQDELSIYYSLVVSSLSSLMHNIYPLCYKILQEDWDAIMIQYQNNYPSKSPIYNRLAADFHKLLTQKDFKEKYPNYLSDLALHEWTDAIIYNSPNQKQTSRLTPVHQVHKFTFPVSQIVQYLKTTEDPMEEIRITDLEEEPEIIFFYRDEISLKNRSFVLAPTSLFVIEALSSGKGLEEIHKDFMAHFNIEVSIDSIKKLLNDLQLAHILLD